MTTNRYTNKTLEERFWACVDKDHPDKCWNWKKTLDRYGYGRISLSEKKIRSAHRASWYIHHGYIDQNLCVCHKCDNPRCVNPHHLFLATHQGNTQDRTKKGRSVRGEKHWSVKLTIQQVLEIRESNEKNIDLAKKYGVCASSIGRIKRRKKWRHV